MQEEKEQRPGNSTSDDATSSKTLSDVEDNENVSEESGDSGGSAPPSPDGAMNSDKDERHKEDDVGPF